MSARKLVKKFDKARIIRSVASSSAIETGQTIDSIEMKLKSVKKKAWSFATNPRQLKI